MSNTYEMLSIAINSSMLVVALISLNVTIIKGYIKEKK